MPNFPHNSGKHSKPRRAFGTAVTGRGGNEELRYPHATGWESFVSAQKRELHKVSEDPREKVNNLLLSLRLRYYSLIHGDTGKAMKPSDTRKKVGEIRHAIATMLPTNPQKEIFQNTLRQYIADFSSAGHKITIK